MTEREFYQHSLIEINKLEAPSLLLEDFNYLANKAIQQYVNKVYNRYDINQQSTDDLRALKRSVALEVRKEINSPFPVPGEDTIWACTLPNDYLHMLNCVVKFKKGAVVPTKKCPNALDDGSDLYSPARRLTADMYPAIMVNAYLKPTHTRPYYYITKFSNNATVEDAATELERLLNPCVSDDEITRRVDNGVNRMELRCGKDNYTPLLAYVDYIKTPNVINLTYADLDGIDQSKELEFDDYVCYEIINELSKLVLENGSDPRLQTNVPINQTIMVPQDSK